MLLSKGFYMVLNSDNKDADDITLTKAPIFVEV
jgi:hypothetical protein